MCCHACLMQCVANTYVATCSTNMCFWAFFQTARSCEQKRMQWFCDPCSVLFVHSYLPKNCWKIRSAIKLKEQALSAWNSTGHGRRMPAGRRLYRCANRWNCPSLSPGSFSTSCWQWRRFQIHHWHTRSLSRIRAGRSSSRFSRFWVAGFKHRGPLTSPRCRRETTWRGWRRVLWRWSHWRATWQSLATSPRPRDPAVQGCCFPPLDLEAAMAETSKTKAFKVAASVGGPAPPLFQIPAVHAQLSPGPPLPWRAPAPRPGSWRSAWLAGCEALGPGKLGTNSCYGKWHDSLNSWLQTGQPYLFHQVRRGPPP